MIPSHLIPKCISSKEPRKSSFNKSEREAIRMFLIIRDGNICKICNKPAGEGEILDIDHIDGNKNNPHHTNLQLAHHKCNCNKNKKGWNKKGVDFLCVCENVSIDENSKLKVNNAELYYKMKYQPAFMEYIQRKFITEGVKIIDVKDMAKNLSYLTGGSTETFKRYAGDLCGSETPFEMYIPEGTKDKYLTIKPDTQLEKIFIKKYVRD